MKILPATSRRGAATLADVYTTRISDIPTVWAIAQADIGKDHIDRMPVAKIGNRSISACGLEDGATFLFQEVGNPCANDGLVLDHENGQRAASRHRIALLWCR